MTVQERAARRLQSRERRPANLWLDAWQRMVRNRAAMIGLTLVTILFLSAILAPQIAPSHYAAGDAADEHTVPSWLAPVLPGSMAGYAKINNKFPLGSDFLGRDLLSRIIYGTRVSFPVGFMGAFTALVIGLVYGCIAGYYGGRVDDILMRIVDILYAFPTMLLIILLMAFFKTTFATGREVGGIAQTFNSLNRGVDSFLGLRGGGMLFIFMGIGLTAWMGMARLARGQILSIKEKEFIEASHMIGASDMRIIIRHIFPNIIGPCLVAETLAIPGYINYEVFLSFIGLGVDPPTPSWGNLISEGAIAIRSYPHVVLFPAICLSLTIFAFNFVGDGLRDALDPRMKGTS
jgi:ABC-type dipeptide/oligopeptide/nickel transport system permease subunit